MEQPTRHKEQFIIGLTGNIGTGKSFVREMLQHLGAFGIDADALANEALRSSSQAYEKIIQRFGSQVLKKAGQLDRKKIAAIVFNDEEALLDLEHILHPLVSTAVRNLIARSRLPIIVIEAIKLLESDLTNLCDKIWVVDAEKDIILDRLTTHRGMTASEVLERLATQSSSASKREQADVVIENNQFPINTWQSVLNAWELLDHSDQNFHTKLETTSDLTSFYKSKIIIPGTDLFSSFKSVLTSPCTSKSSFFWLGEIELMNDRSRKIMQQDPAHLSLSHFIFSMQSDNNQTDYHIWDLSQFNITLKGLIESTPSENNTTLEKQLGMIEDFAKFQLTQTISIPHHKYLKERELIFRELGYNSMTAGDVKDLHRNKAGYNVYQKNIREDFDIFSS